MSDNYVQMNGISIAYESPGLPTVRVVSDFSLAVRSGGSVALVGASGSGKSSLLNVLSGLLRPGAGTVLVDNIRLDELSMDDLCQFRRTHVGFVFQAFHLLPHFTALENVELGASISGANRADVKRRAREALGEVGLAHRGSHRPAQLSGGEQQRVALARVLAAQPKLVLADEPTGNLDPAATELVVETIERLRGLLGATVVLATHSPSVAAVAEVQVSLSTSRPVD